MNNEFPLTNTKLNKLRNTFNKKHGSVIREFEDNSYIIKYRVKMSIPQNSGWDSNWKVLQYETRCIVEIVECKKKSYGGRLYTIDKETDMYAKNRVKWSCNYVIRSIFFSLLRLYGVKEYYGMKMSYKFP